MLHFESMNLVKTSAPFARYQKELDYQGSN